MRPSFFIYFLENFLEVFCDIEPGHGMLSRLRLAGRGKIPVSLSFGVNAAMRAFLVLKASQCGIALP